MEVFAPDQRLLEARLIKGFFDGLCSMGGLRSTGLAMNIQVVSQFTACSVLAVFFITIIVAASSAHAGELSIDDLVKALQSDGQTRSLGGGNHPKKGEEVARLIKEVSSRGLSRITASERKQLVDAVKEYDLPTVDLLVPFEFDSAAISASAVPVLTLLGKALMDERLADASFVVAGHTDTLGSSEYNLGLSRRRAEAVKQFLLSVFNISPQKLVPIGLGEEHLKNKSDPTSGENRRVQLINLM